MYFDYVEERESNGSFYVVAVDSENRREYIFEVLPLGLIKYYAVDMLPFINPKSDVNCDVAKFSFGRHGKFECFPNCSK